MYNFSKREVFSQALCLCFYASTAIVFTSCKTLAINQSLCIDPNALSSKRVCSGSIYMLYNLCAIAVYVACNNKDDATPEDPSFYCNPVHSTPHLPFDTDTSTNADFSTCRSSGRSEMCTVRRLAFASVVWRNCVPERGPLRRAVDRRRVEVLCRVVVVVISYHLHSGVQAVQNGYPTCGVASSGLHMLNHEHRPCFKELLCSPAPKQLEDWFLSRSH